MTKRGSRDALRLVRHAIKEDVLQFALPAAAIWFIELLFCARDGLSGFWSMLWRLIIHPQQLAQWPVHSLFGLAITLIGFVILLVGQFTLGRNHVATVAVRKEHQLITHGIYRYTRNPMYLGILLIAIGLPVYVASLYGFLTGLVLIPLFLNRIRLEERLLMEVFGEAYIAYCMQTRRLIPFLY